MNMYTPRPLLKSLFQSISWLIAFAIMPLVALEVEPIAACETVECEESCNYCFLKDARLEVGYSVGKYIGIKRNYAEYGIFLPVAVNQWIVFADARAYQFNKHHKWGSSEGIGARTDLCDRIIGVNVYHDYLKGRHFGSFNRVGVGLEWLGACWDIRVNGYFPAGSQRNFGRKRTFHWEGGWKMTQRDEEFSIAKGFDAELGAPLFYWCDFELYAAVGPYYYRGNERRDFWGGFARAEVNWRDYVSLQVRTSYDRRYHSHTQFRALLSIPFEALCNWPCFGEYCRNLCIQPVRRNGIIFTDRCCSSTWNW